MEPGPGDGDTLQYSLLQEHITAEEAWVPAGAVLDARATINLRLKQAVATF